ncbi:MAG: YigZ family protein [Candidatus Cloacimonetes bacterium]|nr:YigZ family protein [Candidatus Cloacimonadota bacterium]
MSTYYTIRDSISYELKISRSRFIASIKTVKSIEEAKDFITEISVAHKTATHNCWAYIIGYEVLTEHSSDNGEPSGTAGVPMLNTLKKHKLTNVAVVVTRYFGGVKLGVRGLIDAYGSTVEEALSQIELIKIIPHTHYSLSIPYDFFDILKHRLSEFNPVFNNQEFSSEIKLELSVDSEYKSTVQSLLESWAQSGKLDYHYLGETLF